jgi:uroporphyrinogen-III synthase
VSGRRLLLVHYGERNAAAAEALAARGAIVDEVCPYEWALPEDIEPLEAVIGDAIGGTLDALLFTSQVQFRHLMIVASGLSAADALIGALNHDVVVGAVGPVCAAALRDGGITPDVIPELANTAALVRAIADYFDLTRTDDERQTGA